MKKYLLAVLGILFLGCSVKVTPVYTVIKTPNIKVADQGFLEERFNYKKLIIYKANVPFEMYVYSDRVCLNKKCVSKRAFIYKLSPDYPANFLDNILDKKPINNFGKIINLKNGFMQKTKRFYYLVTNKKVLFKDRQKNIIILIKEIK